MRARRRFVAGAGAVLGLVAARKLYAQQVDLDTPFVTTPDNVVTAMLDLARVGAGDRLIDLGSGDGRIVVAAALRGAVARGVEIDPRLVELSRERALRAGVSARATFSTEDLFDTDFSAADVVSMYLLPDVNAKLAPRLLSTLAPGARIVSHDYGLGDWPPDARIVVAAPGKTVNVDKRSVLMLWIVPARMAGHWEGLAGAKRVTLDIRQRYQTAEGVLRWDGREHAFTDQVVAGRSLALAFPPLGLALTLGRDADELGGQITEGTSAPVAVRLRRS